MRSVRVPARFTLLFSLLFGSRVCVSFSSKVVSVCLRVCVVASVSCVCVCACVSASVCVSGCVHVWSKRNESECLDTQPLVILKVLQERVWQDLKDGECSLRRAKSGETLVKARDDTDVRHAWVLGRKTSRTISQLVPSAVSLRVAGAQQLHQVKGMIGGIGNVPCSTSSQT